MRPPGFPANPNTGMGDCFCWGLLETLVAACHHHAALSSFLTTLNIFRGGGRQQQRHEEPSPAAAQRTQQQRSTSSSRARMVIMGKEESERGKTLSCLMMSGKHHIFMGRQGRGTRDWKGQQWVNKCERHKGAC